MPKPLLRVIACLLVPCLGSAGAHGAAPNSQASFALWTSNAAEAPFYADALAPGAAGFIHCLDRIRSTLVRRSEALLPRYAGAGETSIHKAIQGAERLIQEGKRLEAMFLLDELRDDLIQAEEAKRIEPLMEKWNARYPCDLPVDVIGEAHLGRFVSYVDALFDSIAENAQSTQFESWLLNAVRLGLQRASTESHYASLAEMLKDYMDAENVETGFDVDVAEPLQKILGGPTPLRLTVKGTPTVSKILYELEVQHPALRGRPWALKIEPDVESAGETVLSGQRLRLVLPPSGPAECGGFWRVLSEILLLVGLGGAIAARLGNYAVHPEFFRSMSITAPRPGPLGSA